MSATVADRMIGDRHNPNVELIAQGIANIATPLVGGLPATGAIARTATNIRAGGRTPVAGMVHALTLVSVLLVAAPLARDVPLAVLSGILLVVAYNMGEWSEIPGLLKLSKGDISVWLVTFGLTVFADLTVAVEAGMILAALLMVRKVAVTTVVVAETRRSIPSSTGSDVPSVQPREVKREIAIVRQKKICARPACAVDTAVGRNHRTVMPPSSPCRQTALSAANPRMRIHRRGSARQSQRASMMVRNPTPLAISRWPCS